MALSKIGFGFFTFVLVLCYRTGGAKAGLAACLNLRSTPRLLPGNYSAHC